MPKSKGNSYFISCKKGIDEAEKELGVKLLWDGPTDPDPARQNEIVETWITRGVDVIAVAVENRGGISTALRKARQKGIKVITWDSDAETDARDFLINQATPEGIGSTLMDEAAKVGDLFITATGGTDIITAKHFRQMKDKAILANVGHFDVEVKVKDLERIAAKKRQVRAEVTEYTLERGKRLYLLSQGRLVNLAAGDGHPAEVMDMSFADQALSAEYLIKNGATLGPRVIPVPQDIDREVASQRLQAFGKQIDKLTTVQEKYTQSWKL